MENFNIQPPFIGPQFPTYPHLLQLIRVTSTTVPGPTGYTSSSILAPNLYVSFVEQLRTDNILPRDREPCLALDVNGYGLTPGFYQGRLAGSFNGLPVYEVVCCPPPGLSDVGSSFPGSFTSNQSGYPTGQLGQILLTLTPPQIAILNNLNPCQTQVFLSLTPAQQQLLTNNLTATQLSNVLDSLTVSQFQTLISNLTITQFQTLGSLTTSQVNEIVLTLTTAQLQNLLTLTPAQLSLALLSLTPAQLIIISQLTPTELQSLFSLTLPQISNLADNLTLTQFKSVLDNLTLTQYQLLSNLTSTQVNTLVNSLTTTQLQQVLSNLSQLQLITLTKYQPATISALVTSLKPSDLVTYIDLYSTHETVSPPPCPVLGNQSSFPGIAYIVGQPSSSPAPVPQGYVPTVIDTTGKLWGYISGVWTNLTGGGGSSTTSNNANNSVSPNVTLTNSFANLTTSATFGLTAKNGTYEFSSNWNCLLPLDTMSQAADVTIRLQNVTTATTLLTMGAVTNINNTGSLKVVLSGTVIAPWNGSDNIQWQASGNSNGSGTFGTVNSGNQTAIQLA